MKQANQTTSLQQVVEQLRRDPFHFRVCLTCLAVTVAYFGIYAPLQGQLDIAERNVRDEKQRAELAEEVSLLRAQCAQFQERLAENTDTNQWIQYVLQGVRRFPLELMNLDSREERRVGPYRAVALHLQVMGEMQDLDSLLEWIETNDRVFRVDVLNLEPARVEGSQRMMQLELLGLKG